MIAERKRNVTKQAIVVRPFSGVRINVYFNSIPNEVSEAFAVVKK